MMGESIEIAWKVIDNFLGIHFNAATTQIVPFISLGLGIGEF